MLNLLTQILARFSLPTIHRLGGFVGWAIHFLTPAGAKIQRANLQQSQLANHHLSAVIKANITESGKSLLETFAIWQKKEAELLPLVKKIHHWDVVESALKSSKGIIFLTPHLGCFEIASIYYGSLHPITVLYRAPKQAWLKPLIQAGRARTGVTLAEANANGVRKLLQALKRGEAVGILPDQIPAEGEGEWADFFGKPAYTMTLASKLAEKTGAVVMMAFGERLANGAGYHLHVKKIESIATPTLLNQAIEAQIAQNPSQYLWRYNRYKLRRHALNKQTISSTED